MNRSPASRLDDIVARIDSIRRVEALLSSAPLFHDEDLVAMAINSILYDLLVVEEAVRSLPEELMALEPTVPWRRIVGLRNRLAHEYFSIDVQVIAGTIDRPLAELHAACLRLRET